MQPTAPASKVLIAGAVIFLAACGSGGGSDTTPPISLSGDTGNTGGLPHLHFSVHPCGALPGLPGTGDCPSEPVNFRNTYPNQTGLNAGNSYEALPF